MYSTLNKPATADFKNKSPRLFFGNITRSAPFFPPVIQRQPAPGEQQVELSSSDIIQLGKEINQDLEKGKQSLCELIKAFMQQAINPNAAIDATAQDAIDAFTNFTTACSSICPYITKKVPSIKGHLKVFQHYRGNDDPKSKRFLNDTWHQAVGKYLNTNDPEKIAKVGGFYDDKDKSISLPSDALTGSALHEAIHRLSQRAFRDNFGHYLNEGVTQYFTDYVIKELGLPVFTRHDYKSQLQDATALAGRIGDVALAKMYFGANHSAEREAMMKLGIIKSENDLYFYGEADILKAIGSKHKPD